MNNQIVLLDHLIVFPWFIYRFGKFYGAGNWLKTDSEIYLTIAWWLFATWPVVATVRRLPENYYYLINAQPKNKVTYVMRAEQCGRNLLDFN